MSVTLQVLYPVTETSSFDYDYYLSTHMDLVDEHMGAHIESTLVTKGTPTPDGPPPFHAVATIVFADVEARDIALAAAGPVLADIPKFTDTQPQVLLGELVG